MKKEIQSIVESHKKADEKLNELEIQLEKGKDHVYTIGMHVGVGLGIGLGVPILCILGVVAKIMFARKNTNFVQIP